MKILIVDDNKNNRMILKLFLEDYAEDNHSVKFLLDEAEDGLEAVKKCEENTYDIVFMDIMMPKMDGIEATRLIRQSNKKIMIIAVSAVDDSERQKLILTNGAEDYISKPVNCDIFNSRVSNYITLIKSREHNRSSENYINLFTKEIYSRHTKFLLSSEDSLAELWEFFLLDAQEKYDGLSDIVRTMFSLGEIQLRLGIKSNLYVEESEEYQYFTLLGLKSVPSKLIELTLKKNSIDHDYKLDADKISFVLQKIVTGLEEEIVISSKNTIVEPVAAQQEDVINNEYTSVKLQVYDYLETDDMVDLEEYSGRLSSLMLVVGSGDITDEELVEMYTYIEKLGAILSTYSEVYQISLALSTLASDMATHSETFIQNAEALGPLCSAFSKDLMNWMEMSFSTGAPSADFMNETIAVNCQTIGGMLKMDEAPATDDDFDDIFDF